MTRDNIHHQLDQFIPPEFYKLIVEEMRKGIWVGDKHHRTIYVNPAFERLLGYSKGDWYKKHSYSYFDRTNVAVVEHHNRLRLKGKTSHYRVHVLAKNGSPVPVFMSGSPAPRGGTIGILTDLRNLEK